MSVTLPLTSVSPGSKATVAMKAAYLCLGCSRRHLGFPDAGTEPMQTDDARPHRSDTGAGGRGTPPGPSAKSSGETAGCCPTPGRLQSHTPPGKAVSKRAHCADEK